MGSQVVADIFCKLRATHRQPPFSPTKPTAAFGDAQNISNFPSFGKLMHMQKEDTGPAGGIPRLVKEVKQYSQASTSVSKGPWLSSWARCSVAELLDCEGPHFGSTWSDLLMLATQHHASGVGPLSAPRELLDLAARVSGTWTPFRAAKARRSLPDVFMGRLPARLLAGFCAHGFLTSLFWRCFDIAPEARAADVAMCLRGLTTGPVDTQDWGPLEFSESTRWPVKVLDVRLLHEHWAACGDAPVFTCPDVSASELRVRLGLGDVPASAMTGTSQAVVGHAVAAAAVAVDAMSPRQWLHREQASTPDIVPLKLAVIGSHLGSNAEPLWMVLACAREAAVNVEAVVYGTQYPWPELMCELFGYCQSNRWIDEAVGLLKRQMYRPEWEPVEVLAVLQEAFLQDPTLQQTELLVCAQPMVICALMRTVTELPMLIYQAFPLIGATPAIHMPMLLLLFREIMRVPRRSAFVAYSEFLASQVAYQVGQRPLCLRPHSLYATERAHYDPDRENPRVLVSRMAGWARDGAVALVHLTEALAERELRPSTRLRLVFLGMSREPSETVAGIVQPFGYSELRRFRAAVYFPWDMGMLLFSELYNIGVPLLLPSRSWMLAIIKRMLEYTDFGWWQVRSESAVSLPGTAVGSGVWPWVGANSSMLQILELYDRTDFVRWPYVDSFGSLPGLMARLRSLEFDRVSSLMRRWNGLALARSMGILSRALGALLGGGDPPQPGESSCV